MTFWVSDALFSSVNPAAAETVSITMSASGRPNFSRGIFCSLLRMGFEFSSASGSVSNGTPPAWRANGCGPDRHRFSPVERASVLAELSTVRRSNFPCQKR